MIRASECMYICRVALNSKLRFSQFRKGEVV